MGEFRGKRWEKSNTQITLTRSNKRYYITSISLDTYFFLGLRYEYFSLCVAIKQTKRVTKT